MVHSGDIHDAIDHDRRALDHALTGHGEEPFGRQAADIATIDLIQLAMAIGRIVAVIRRPIDVWLNSCRHVFLTVAPQEVNPPIGGADLSVESALVEQLAAQHRSIGEFKLLFLAVARRVFGR